MPTLARILFGFVIAASAFAGTPVGESVSPLLPLPLDAVKLQGSLGQRYQGNVDYLFWRYRDMDRLLFPFEHRDRWERVRDWDGEYVGKWLEAAALTATATRLPALEIAIDEVAARLRRTQEPDGYLGTELPAYRLQPSWPHWMNWLAMKALREHGASRGDQASLSAARRAGDWILAQFHPIEDEKNDFFRGNGVLAVIDELAELTTLTGDPRYAEFAAAAIAHYPPMRKMRASGKVEPLHSYSAMTYLGGAVRVAQVRQDAELLNWIGSVWDDIAAQHTFPTASNSTDEHFKELPTDVLNGKLQETCATVEWVIFTHRLYLATGAVRYANMLERTVRNALLGAQSVDGRKWTYFTPMRNRKKWLEGPTDCCFFSGPRGIARLPALVYYRDADGLRVDLVESGEVEFKVENVAVTVRQTSASTAHTGSRLVIHVARPVEFTLRLRIPERTTDPVLVINGARQSVNLSAGSHHPVRRMWQNGDVVELSVKPSVTVDRLIDGTAVISRGVEVLSLDTRDNELDLENVRLVLPLELSAAEAAAGGRPRYRCMMEVAGQRRPILLTPFAEAGNSTVGMAAKSNFYRTAFPIADNSSRDLGAPKKEP